MSETEEGEHNLILSDGKWFVAFYIIYFFVDKYTYNLELDVYTH